MVCWHTDKTVGKKWLRLFFSGITVCSDRKHTRDTKLQYYASLMSAYYSLEPNNSLKYQQNCKYGPVQYQNLMSSFLRRYVSQHTILNEALWWYRDIPDLKIIFSSCRESAYFADLRKTCINIIRLFSVKFFPLKLQLISQYLSWRWHSHSHTHTHTHTHPCQCDVLSPTTLCCTSPYDTVLKHRTFLLISQGRKKSGTLRYILINIYWFSQHNGDYDSIRIVLQEISRYRCGYLTIWLSSSSGFLKIIFQDVSRTLSVTI